MPERITKKEYKDWVEGQLISSGFTAKQRREIEGVTNWTFEHEDWREHAERVGTFLGTAQPGMTKEELEVVIKELGDANSSLSKSLKIPIRKDQVDKLEEIMHEALEGNKEHLY